METGPVRPADLGAAGVTPGRMRQAAAVSVVAIVEEIMAQHWDLKPCRCWICQAGRAAGCHARSRYLDRDNTHGRVWVDPATHRPKGWA